MQVNYMYHPKAFTNFDNAFNPDINVEWASKKLISLYKKFGSWKKAVGYYHSYRNTRRRKYSAKVYNTLLFVKNNKNYDIVSSNNDQNPDNYQDIAFKNNVKIKTQTNKVNRKPINQFNTEPNININAYLGNWYQVATSRSTALLGTGIDYYNVQAEYGLCSNGISVFNSGYQSNGNYTYIEGYSYVEGDKETK